MSLILLLLSISWSVVMVACAEAPNCSQLLYAECESDCIHHEVSGHIFKKFKECTNYEASRMPEINEDGHAISIRYYSSSPSVINLDLLKKVRLVCNFLMKHFQMCIIFYQRKLSWND